jgi:N,N'-diacetyllegionaminate synthase
VAIVSSTLEKHFTLDRGLPGPDHQASIEPPALRELVRRVRDVEAALGHGRKEPTASEAAIARVARKSLVAGRRIPAGTVLEQEMVVARRPGTGLPPDQLDLVVGRRARSDIPEGTVLQMDMLS